MNNNRMNPKSPFYRVTVKGIIKDDQNRLLVVEHREGHYEIPGGGLEHGEQPAEGLCREIEEEIGIQPKEVGEVLFLYTSPSTHGYMVCRTALAATIELSPNIPFRYGDGMVAARFVTRQEFQELPLVADEAGMKGFADKIWPNS